MRTRLYAMQNAWEMPEADGGEEVDLGTLFPRGKLDS